jgi:phospholipid/cholesterol/gamma-HCH transport system substrate-binding protein
MKRGNEFLVGLVLLLAIVVTVAAALWLSEANIGRREQLHVSRFRTVGGLGPGAPVTLRGVRVGRVEGIRLAESDWVEADLRVYQGVELPANPAVIAASQSLFGEWGATIVSYDEPQDDPNVRQLLDEAARGAGGRWPGATLPDVGQLTAQAGRIATDIAAVAERVQTTFDSNAVRELRQSIKDFANTTNNLVRFTQNQSSRLNQVTGNIDTTARAVRNASENLQTVLSRIEAATDSDQLHQIVSNTQNGTASLQQAAADIQTLTAAARSHEASLISVLLAADSVMSRIQTGQGTLGMLARDSALYVETTATMKDLHQLIEDIRANPRKYFKFSVF